MIYKLYTDHELLKWSIANKELLKSYNQLLTDYYERDFTILNFLLSSFKSNHNMKFLIIFNETDVVGLARLKYNGDVKISSVIVNPKYRRQQICTKMISFLLKYAVKYNKDIILEVKKDNIGAIKCYQANKFKQIGENKYGEYIMKYLI